MKDNLEIFRQDYLNANSWMQRKDGVPLDLLDNLSEIELKIAEKELIDSTSLKDSWPIIGLGHIKSKDSLPKLYDLLPKAKSHMRVIIAHSIFQICKNNEMIEVTLNEVNKITNQYEIIDILYMLPDFEDSRIDSVLHDFREHKQYLVAYNATRVLGLSTDDIVEKFRNK